MKIFSTGFCFFSLVLAGTSAWADVTMPAIFSDHMVLQQDATAPVWGWADPGEEVTVAIGGQTKATAANADGRWQVALAALKPGEPLTLTVKGRNEVVIKDVLVGEVWIASGQSNMAFTFSRGGYSETEKAAANHPKLRMFTVEKNAQRQPQKDVAGKWIVSSSETVGDFSAVAYFFGRDLHDRLGVPVGMINTSWGGTDIAAWTSEDAQVKLPELKAQFVSWATLDAEYDPATARAKHSKSLEAWKKNAAKAKAAGTPEPRKPSLVIQPRTNPNYPANLYNGMIAPLIPYALRGAIWYQGEHNCSSLEKASLYAKQLPLLIADWRARWGSEFPFAWVQLPNFEHDGFRPLVREAMLKSLSVKNTGMAITTDIGEAKDNHPKNKQDVGKRLALWALGTVYGKDVPATSGPLPAGHEIRGGDVILSFTHANRGLVAKGGPSKGFQIAGEDKVWKPAQATIKGDRVIVSSGEVPKPAAVRYAWASNPDGNLFNGAGLPASPFRTDAWEVVATK